MQTRERCDQLLRLRIRTLGYQGRKLVYEVVPTTGVGENIWALVIDENAVAVTGRLAGERKRI